MGMRHSPIRERTLHLNFVQPRRDPGQDVPPPQHRLPVLHELCDGVLAIPNALLQLGRDESNCLGVIQLHAPREAFLREEARLE